MLLTRILGWVTSLLCYPQPGQRSVNPQWSKQMAHWNLHTLLPPHSHISLSLQDYILRCTPCFNIFWKSNLLPLAPYLVCIMKPLQRLWWCTVARNEILAINKQNKEIQGLEIAKEFLLKKDIILIRTKNQKGYLDFISVLIHYHCSLGIY